MKFMLGFVVLSLVGGCNFKETKDPPADPNVVVPNNLKFADVKAQVFDVYCKSCHLNGANLGDLSLDSYAEVKAVLDSGSGELRNRTLVTKDMPSGGLDPAPAAIIKAWLDAGAPE